MEYFDGNCTHFQTDEFRRIIFSISIAVSCLTVLLNLILLASSPFLTVTDIKIPVHIFYIFLGISDLINGVSLTVYAMTLLDSDDSIWRNYGLCTFVALSSNTMLTITGYTLMLISIMQCVSVVFPLRSRAIITNTFAVVCNVLTWSMCIILMSLIPIAFLTGSRDGPMEEECTGEVVFRGNMDKARQLSIFVGSIFIVGILISNFGCLMVIVKRHIKVRHEFRPSFTVNDTLPTSKATQQPSAETSMNVKATTAGKGYQKTATDTSLVKPTENANSLFSSKPYLENNITNDLPNNSETNTQVPHETVQVPHEIVHVPREIAHVPHETVLDKVPVKIRTSSTKRLLSQSNTPIDVHNEKGKAQLRKAFYMVFMRLAFYFLCLAPLFIVVGLSGNVYSSKKCRAFRFLTLLFLQITSFINPILTLTTVPVFRTVFKKMWRALLKRTNLQRMTVN